MSPDPPMTPPAGVDTTTLVPRAVDLVWPLAARAGARPAAPTPCQEYTVEQLGTHLVAMLGHGVRAGNAQHTTGASAGSWERYAETATALATAWSNPAGWTGTTQFHGGRQRRGFIGSIMVMELVVHGWDLARALDVPYLVDDDLVATSLAAARENDALGARDFGAFGPQQRRAQLGALDHLIAYTGRDIRWVPPA